METVLDGLRFPEGPRWHDGALWFSDMHAKQVVRFDGAAEVVCEVEAMPSGLGWDAQGRLLVVSMTDRRLLRREPDGALVEVADLSGIATGPCNDMVVDRHGRAYVGNFGWDRRAGDRRRSAAMARVDPDGTASVAADDLEFPNGTVITDDGRTLVVGETYGARLTAFTVLDDGTLADRRVWAGMPDRAVPDGICLDAEGAIWVASPTTDEVLRVAEGGTVLARIPTGRGAYACMLGGPDRRTLFVCTAAGSDPERTTDRTGRIEAIALDVPGTGLP